MKYVQSCLDESQYICIYSIHIYTSAYIYMFVFTYMYIHTCIHAYKPPAPRQESIHMYMYMYIHIRMHIYKHLYLHIYIRIKHSRLDQSRAWKTIITCTYIYMNAYVRTHMNMGIHTCVYLCICIHMRMYIHSYVNMSICTCIHIYKPLAP